MSWSKMRIPVAGQGDSLPGERGRYLLWLEPPHVEGEGHYVHFSWKESSFCIRDYMQQKERRQEPSLTALDVWAAASDRIPAKGELYVPVENFEFWIAKLNALSESRSQGRTPSLWSRLSSKFAPKSNDSERPASEVEPDLASEGEPTVKGNDVHTELDRNVYRSFMAFWSKGAGFEVIERTVGCSARYENEPILWVYPTYFQVAPQGKGNAHYDQVMDLRQRHFPGLTKGNIRFRSEHFSWDRFQAFTTDVQELIRKTGN